MAENIENSKYKEIFIKIFNVQESMLNTLEYKICAEWNSMAQLALISSIEEAYNIEFDIEDIYAFTSYIKGKELLETKFGIKI